MEAIEQKCSCDFCKRHRRYLEIKEKVENEEVFDFLREVYQDLVHTIDDLEYERIKRRAYTAKFGHFDLTESVKIIKEYESNGKKERNIQEANFKRKGKNNKVAKH